MARLVLVVDREAPHRERLVRILTGAGYPARGVMDGAAALAVLGEGGVGLVLCKTQAIQGIAGAIHDGRALLRQIRARHPGTPVLLMTGEGSIAEAVAAMREGAADYLLQSLAPQELLARVAALWVVPEVAPGAGSGADLQAHHARGVAPEEALAPAVASVPEDAGPVAVDPITRQILSLAARVAVTDTAVLITGESGVGKEELFRSLHRYSLRARGPVVAVNCAAIPENMLEATLFGYEKGAFTGACRSLPGKFEQAAGGSLLLDEIGELPLALQAKLLRVLQEKEVERIGSTRTLSLDVRVVATTNRDLRQEVAQGRFREDLFYRLCVFPIHLPPLRARPQDILPLAERFLRRAALANGVASPGLTDEARAMLQAHRWPGNVRELDNVMQRAAILHQDGVVRATDLILDEIRVPAARPLAAKPLAEEGGGLEDPRASGSPPMEGLGEDVRAHECRLILGALAEGHGSRKYAAERLGLNPRTLRYKIAKMRAQGIALPGQSLVCRASNASNMEVRG
jgi:two-component system response regulator FlrC